MRILFLARSLETGGAERQLILLAAGLKGRGHDVRVATFYSGGALERDLQEAGVPLLPLGKRSRWDLTGFTKRLRRALHDVAPEILMGFLVGPNLISSVLRPLASRPRIVWGLRASDMDWNRYDAFSRFSFALSVSLSRYADLLLVNSREGLRHHAASGFPRDRLRYVPNGIDVDRFRPDRRAGLPLREQWAPGERARLVGLVGRVDPMKDPLTFLRAAERLAAWAPHVRFVWIGPASGTVAEVWRAHGLARRLGARLTWAGEVAAMFEAYNALDVLVLSSLSEGFPNAVAEAMACGIPCVVTRAGDAGEIVGETGTVVDPRDAFSLARGVAGILADGPPPPRTDARDRIVRLYGLDTMLDRMEELFTGLVEESAR